MIPKPSSVSENEHNTTGKMDTLTIPERYVLLRSPLLPYSSLTGQGVVGYAESLLIMGRFGYPDPLGLC